MNGQINLGYLDEEFLSMFLFFLRINNIIKHSSNVLDNKMKEMLNFDYKDLTFLIVRDEPGFNYIQSYEVAESVSKQCLLLN